MRNIFTLLVSLFIALPIFSQEKHFSCAHRDAQLELEKTHPEIAIKREQYRPILKKRQQEIYNNHQKSGDEYIIPVVFHIIHADGPENISNAQVFNAIQCLNKDFSGTRDDIGEVVADFKDRIANTGIIFKLAQLDPEGNCTNGIVRYYDERTSEGADQIKAGRIWPNDRYLNIFVVKEVGLAGAAGYAYYPGAGPQIDGIVINYQYVGAIGASEPGRSAALSHEAGHWLHLDHAWGTNNLGDGNNCFDPIGDDVDDTPTTIGNSSCNLESNTCGVGDQGDEIDNVQNIMEYAYCFRMFTTGQGARMIATLQDNVENRNNLWTPNNLLLTGVQTPNNELCKVDFVPTQNQGISAGTKVVFADVSNNHVVSRLWSFPGGTPSSSTDSMVTVTYNTQGEFDVTLTATGTNGSKTLTQPKLIKVYKTSPVFFEDFKNGLDGNNILDYSWETYSEGDASYWEYRGPTTSPSNSSGSLGSCSAGYGYIQSASWNNGFMIFDSDWWDNGGNGCGSGTGLAPGTQHAALYLSGALDFTGKEFVEVRGTVMAVNYSAKTTIEISTTGGVEYIPVKDIMPLGTPISSGSSTKKFRVIISDYVAGKSDVFLRFNWDGYYYFVQLDDIEIVTNASNVGVDETPGEKMKIFVRDGKLMTEGAEVKHISVFDLSGRLLGESDKNGLKLPAVNGILVVKVESDQGVSVGKILN